MSPQGLWPLSSHHRGHTNKHRGSNITPNLTLIVHLEPWPVLGMVTVEVDDGQVGGAEQDRRNQRACKLSNQGRAVLRPSPDLQEVVVVFGREVLELNSGSCEATVMKGADQV